MKAEEPYIIKTEIVESHEYNPAYGDDRECKCGHVYYRHFDSYDHMRAVGCKYCQCWTFEEALKAHLAAQEPQDKPSQQLTELFHNSPTNRGKQTLADKAIADLQAGEHD